MERTRSKPHRKLTQLGQGLCAGQVKTRQIWLCSAACFWPGNQLHIPDLVPGFASGIGQPVKGFAVWSVHGDDQNRCTKPAKPPKLLTVCQHNQIAGGRVLEIWGHRCTVETSGDALPGPQRNP